jgi:hypothetical protein
MSECSVIAFRYTTQQVLAKSRTAANRFFHRNHSQLQDLWLQIAEYECANIIDTAKDRTKLLFPMLRKRWASERVLRDTVSTKETGG